MGLNMKYCLTYILSYRHNFKKKYSLCCWDLFDKLLSGIYCIPYFFPLYIYFLTIIKLMVWRHYDYVVQFMKVCCTFNIFRDLSYVYWNIGWKVSQIENAIYVKLYKRSVKFTKGLIPIDIRLWEVIKNIHTFLYQPLKCSRCCCTDWFQYIV